MPSPTSPPERRPGGLRRTLVELGPAGPLVLVAMAGPLVGAGVLAATTSTWLPWFAADLGSMLVFLACGAFATACCLLPTHATSLAAGFLFGSGPGAMVAWLVILVAATMGFALWTPIVGERALGAIKDSPRGMAVHRALLGAGFLRAAWVIALLRLSPLLPFAATNLLLAAFSVRGTTFLVATVIGITPRAIGVALVGAGLSDLDWQAGNAPWSTLLAIAATLLAVVLIGRIARQALRRATAGPPEPPL